MGPSSCWANFTDLEKQTEKLPFVVSPGFYNHPTPAFAWSGGKHHDQISVSIPGKQFKKGIDDE